MFDIQHYETTKELMSNIPIECVVRDYNTHILYSLKVKNIHKNDIISLSSEFEITQNNPYMVMIGSYIIITDMPYSAIGDYIVSPNGFNLDNKIHHAVPTHNRNYKSTRDYLGTYYINLVIYSASTDALKNDTLLIEKNYGHLDAIIYNVSNY